LCENETNVKVIQTVMGHKDIQTTLDIYAEVSEQKKQDVFSQIVEDNIL
jgi:site-specific recombinase XerD